MPSIISKVEYVGEDESNNGIDDSGNIEEEIPSVIPFP
jgi:hypothetical protein